MKILITGANGFTGRALSAEAFRRGFRVCAAVRELCTLPSCIDIISVGDIDCSTNWSQALRGCDAVIHLAARAHVRDKVENNPLEDFRRVNFKGTMNLALQAAAAGVRRFVFISSIGVNGAETSRAPFSYLDQPAPHSSYAASKYEAELGLQKLGKETGMEIVIIRPPLIYGPNAPGNFGSMMRWLMLGIPLPLGSIKNRRSFVALDNLVDLILICVMHPKAANKIFLVSDGEDLSTTELLRRIGRAMNRPVFLLPVPASYLAFAAKIFNKMSMAQSLMGTLQVDISHTCEVLNWIPPVSVDEGLRRAVEVRS